MNVAEIVTAWLAGTNGATVALGSWPAVEALEAPLRAAGVPIARLGQALLDGLPDAAELAQAELEAADAVIGEGGRGRRGERTGVLGRIREALAARLAQVAEELAAGEGPIAVRDFELAVAERLDLDALAGLGRPVLLLVPGRRKGEAVLIFGTGEQPGVALPRALAARVWMVDGDDR